MTTTVAVFRVRESFSFDVNGVPTVLCEGQLVTEDHPAFSAARRHLFEPAEDAADRGTVGAVEVAVSPPGGPRVLSRPTRRLSKD